MEIRIPPNALLFDIIPVFNNNFLVILQTDPLENKRTKG